MNFGAAKGKGAAEYGGKKGDDSKSKKDYEGQKMKKSKTGYLKNSPDVNNKQNLIPSNKITMKGVGHKVKGVDNRGYTTIMYPGYDYIFPNGNQVLETKLDE